MLKPRKKLTKREIKEDPLVTQYVKYQKMLQTYSRQVYYGLIAVAVIITVSVLVSNSKKSAEARAEGDLVVAEQMYFSRDFDRAPLELKRVSDDYPGTKAAGRAVFFRANALYNNADYENAYQAYKEYVDDYGQVEVFKISSFAGMAACQENQLKYANAADLYKKAANVNKSSFNAVHHFNSAARCYRLADMTAEAKSIYQMILDEYPETPVIEDVKFWMAAI